MSRSGRERGQKPLPRHYRYVILERDGDKCAICKKPIGDIERATLDHIVPRAFGGRDRIENLQLAHFHCNYKQGTKGMDREKRIAMRDGRLG
jgi:5-methylcytosine-specific restriction endonuclease McrA